MGDCNRVVFAICLRASGRGKRFDKQGILAAHAEAEKVTARLIEDAEGDVARLVAAVFSWCQSIVSGADRCTAESLKELASETSV